MNKECILRKLNEAAEAYYNNQEEIMSDEEYDKLSQYASEQRWITEDSQLNDGITVDNTEIKHNIPMLSLAKAKTEEEIKRYYNYIRKFNTTTGFMIEPKLDGLAISVKYKNGIPYEIASRGDGKKGESLNCLLSDDNLQIDNFILKIDNTDEFELRGELYCSKKQLEFNNKSRGNNFKNERIAAAGIVSKCKKGLDYKAQLSFNPYFAFNKYGRCSIDKRFLPSYILFPKHEAKNIEQLLGFIEVAKLWRENLSNIPTDGVVIKPTEIFETEKATDHHPKEFIAYKYPGETKSTKLIDVKWQVGPTGRITPVAVIEPVIIDNVEITNITLHNIEWIQKMNVKINSIVEVTRANDVIPAINKVILNDENSEDIIYPAICPYCSSTTEKTRKFIYCTNTQCKPRLIGELSGYASRGCLDIEGLNEAVVETMIDDNKTNIIDLISVDLEYLENLKYSTSDVSLGLKRANIIYSNIKNTKENTTQIIWLTTLGFPNVGQTVSKLLLNKFGSIDNFLNNVTSQELETIKGIGPETIQNILDNLNNARNLWSQLRQQISIIPIKNTQNNLGSFCVTGNIPEHIKNSMPIKNRDEFTKYLEAKGYEYHKSLKNNTTYLITDNPEGNSSKLKKARQLGIEIMSFDEFI